MFELRKVRIYDPAVSKMLHTYLKKFKVNGVAQPSDKEWWALYDGDAMLLTFAYIKRDDGGMEITDVYLKPCREAFAALDYAAEKLNMALARGIFPYAMGTTFFKNKRMQRWITRYMGKAAPDSVGFIFPGSTLDSRRREALA